MNRDSPIVVDTHALIWHLEGSPKLSREATLALRSIERGERGGIVPSIVLAELIHIAEKGRTTLDAAETISEIGR